MLPLVFPERTWEHVEPSEVGIDKTRLIHALRSFSHTRGDIVITRFGRIAYIEGDEKVLRPVWCTGKSLMALIAGRLVSSGKLDLDQELELSNNPPAAARHYNEHCFQNGHTGGPLRTLRQFLAMTDSFGLQNAQPGLQCLYSMTSCQFYSMYIKERFFPTASDDISFLKQGLTLSLGFEDEITLTGQVGGTNGGYRISARDLARVGLLVLAKGNWNGTQLISEEFMKAACTSQVPGTTSRIFDGIPPGFTVVHPLTRSLPYRPTGYKGRMGGDIGYGYSFWLLPDHEKTGAVHTSGRDGNYIIIDFQNQLVIVTAKDVLDVNDYSVVHPSAMQYLNAVRVSLVHQQEQHVEGSSCGYCLC